MRTVCSLYVFTIIYRLFVRLHAVHMLGVARTTHGGEKKVRNRRTNYGIATKIQFATTENPNAYIRCKHWTLTAVVLCCAEILKYSFDQLALEREESPRCKQQRQHCRELEIVFFLSAFIGLLRKRHSTMRLPSDGVYRRLPICNGYAVGVWKVGGRFNECGFFHLRSTVNKKSPRNV